MKRCSLTLRGNRITKMTDEDFLLFCYENSDKRVERNSHREIILRPAMPKLYRRYNKELFFQLHAWNEQKETGTAFGAYTGFMLNDGSVLSPSVSWFSNQRWENVLGHRRACETSVCPEFLIELRSSVDSIVELKDKMNVWIKLGVQLAWLIDPIKEAVYVYRPNEPVLVLMGFHQILRGEGPVGGFSFDLSYFRDEADRD